MAQSPSYTPSPAPSAGSTPGLLRQPSADHSSTPLSSVKTVPTMSRGGGGARPSPATSQEASNYLPVNITKHQGLSLTNRQLHNILSVAVLHDVYVSFWFEC